MPKYEQGPIRPPSEASSLLVRVSRNCPWNRCVFCPVYKGDRFSFRSTEEVLADLDAMRSEQGPGVRTVFLQDANPLLTKPDSMVRILDGIRERFPNVERITTYARSDILARRPVDDLRRYRAAGLNRLHVGLESGSDAVLSLIRKGVTREQQIVAGQRVKEAGLELSEYVMPGIGGRALSDCHADETASALAAIGPDFVRLRTTTVIRGTELADMQSRGEFELLDETAVVAEIRRFIVAMGHVETRLESDHMMNLLMELQGDLPADTDSLIETCDAFLSMPAETRDIFILGRRLGRLRSLGDLERPGMVEELRVVLQQLSAAGHSSETLFAELRGRAI